jgi:hypothetical protein
MTLEFGVFDHLDRNDLPLHDFYEQRLKVIEAFDRTGFYAYHVCRCTTRCGYSKKSACSIT